MPYTQLENVAPQEKVRVDFDDGNWWEILVEQPYGVSRQVRQLSTSVIRITDSGEEQVRDFSEIPASDLHDMAEKIRSLRLLRCSVAWSWDDPITEESIDRRRSSHVLTVVEKMDELYGGKTDQQAESERPLEPGS